MMYGLFYAGTLLAKFTTLKLCQAAAKADQYCLLLN